MKQPQERLNEQLDQLMQVTRHERARAGSFPLPFDQRDPDQDALVTLADQLRATPQLQVDPVFASQLERRLLLRLAEQQQKPARDWSWPLRWRMHPALAAIAIFCLVLLVCGTAMLTMAAHASDPGSPLYGVNQWEQHVQYTLASSPQDQAALDLQFAREHLDDLSSLVKQGRSGDYLATLSAFDQQYTAAAKAIEALPENAQRAQLASQLNTLEEDARQDLYVFLPNINLAGELATTSELGKLGETIPRLSSATVVFSLYPGGPVLISFAGSGIQAGAQLLIGDQVIPATGMTRAGQLVFIAREGRTWQPQSLGILNPDGTAAQTSTIHLKTPDEHGPGNGSGPGHGRGGKPGVTPTPTWPTPSPRF